jgi:hypothetical protein
MKSCWIIILCLWSAYLPWLIIGFWNHFEGNWGLCIFGLFLLIPTLIIWANE